VPAEDKDIGRTALSNRATRPTSKLIDLEMLLMPGGARRTAEEFASLFEHFRFEPPRIVPTESPLYVMEARIAQRT
jgi:hypothetical protein